MKSWFKKIILQILTYLALKKLERNKKAKIIGVTGSIGKTSTKDGIVFALSKLYKVQAGKGSLNTEFGVPLSILGEKSGYSNPLKWTLILLRSFYKAFLSEKVDYFVIEMGVDSPGDMNELLKIVKPDISIITKIEKNHIADGQFNSVKEIADEKKLIVTKLRKNKIAILNAKDLHQKRIAKEVKAKIVFYNNAKLYVEVVQETLHGMKLNLHIDGKSYPFVTKVIGDFHAGIFLTSVAIAKALRIDLPIFLDALEKYTLPPGRMSVIEGVNHSTLIDSSYNASVASVKNVLKTLKSLPAKRKIVALGNLNELGSEATKIHKRIGEFAGELNFDYYYLMGINQEDVKAGLIKSGVEESKILLFPNSTILGNNLKKLLIPGDVVAFKGSQNKVRMERAVKIVMKNPEHAKTLLCRQGDFWLKN